MIQSSLLALSRNLALRDFLAAAPLTRDVVNRFVAGRTWAEALPRVHQLVDQGLKVTVDILGEDTTEVGQAEAVAASYHDLLGSLADQGLASTVEVSAKPTALGLNLLEGDSVAVSQALAIAQHARRIGTTLTIDMEDHTTTERTVQLVEAVRQEVPETGCVLQANLRRTVADCQRMDGPAARNRLCKGAYTAPGSAAFRLRNEVDRSFVRGLRLLMEGQGRPLVATHDDTLIEIAQELASRTGRGLGDFEFQMLYGVRPREQVRLAELGFTVRVYVPFGPDWYGYLMRRLAERPANLAFFLKALARR
jgi:proline dehydrogenase